MKDGKTKATNRNMRSKKDGSVLNANHVTLEATREGQTHIDESRFKYNAYWRFESNGKTTLVNGGSGGFNATKHEIKRYKELFGKGQDAKNERYINNRNKGNCRTIEELYRNPKTAPLETLWQIGNSKTQLMPTHELKLALFKAWSETVKEIRKEWGENVKFLDAGLHMEEAVPHIHSRIVLGATDEHGFFMPNQTQAFKEMGIERPDPTKAVSRYNNPLIAFSDKVREMFYQNCERQGIQIDREVQSTSKRRIEILEYKCQEAAKELEVQRQAAQSAQQALERTVGDIKTLERKISALETAQTVLEVKNNSLTQENESLRSENKELRLERNNLSVQVSRISTEIEYLRKQKEEAERNRDAAIKEKELAVDKLEKIEEYQNGLYRRLGSKTVKKYGKVQAQAEKKNLRGQVVQEARPECTLVATEDLELLEERAAYRVSVDYNRDTVRKIDATIQNDEVIQELKNRVEELSRTVNSQNLDIEKKDKAIKEHEEFLRERGLEAAFNAPVIEHEIEHHHHRRI